MANWERKSRYLLHESVKFGTYIDCLRAAQAEKEKIYAGRSKSSHDQQPAHDTAGIQSTEAPAQQTEEKELAIT